MQDSCGISQMKSYWIIHTQYTQSDQCKVHQTTLEGFSGNEHSILVTAVKLLYK
jgi:hypothetical protein